MLTRRIEADFQCLRGDDHARDMAFDEVAVREAAIVGKDVGLSACMA